MEFGAQKESIARPIPLRTVLRRAIHRSAARDREPAKHRNCLQQRRFAEAVPKNVTGAAKRNAKPCKHGMLKGYSAASGTRSGSSVTACR
jgi:hypothetical protein